MTHFDDVYQQLSGHLKRIAKMQHQLDGLTASVPSLVDPAVSKRMSKP